MKSFMEIGLLVFPKSGTQTQTDAATLYVDSFYDIAFSAHFKHNHYINSWLYLIRFFYDWPSLHMCILHFNFPLQFLAQFQVTTLSFDEDYLYLIMLKH